MKDEHGKHDGALSVWTVTDGKIGDDVQCRAVAAGLASAFSEKRVEPRAPWEWAAPWGPVDPRDAPEKPGSPIAPPFPDVLIASGRRAIPYARAVKKASGGETLLVFLKNPRFGFADADVVWAPAHDRLSGKNVFTTLTSPHLHGAQMEAARKNPAPAIGALPKPALGVVVGGPGGGGRYNARTAADLAAKIRTAAEGYAAVAVTPSRRTPDFMMQELRKALAGKTAFVWDGKGENPYLDILANADALIVTADSHNMMSEALATGAGVYVYRPPGLAPKLAWFLEELSKRGAVRTLERAAPPFFRSPINATDEIVGEIRKRLAAKSA